MHDIIVIGPVDGVYHLGYRDVSAATFYSFNTFVGKELAHAAAWKMNRDRERNNTTNTNHG